MFYIKDFLDNPAGKGSAVLNIHATKNDYKQRYDTLSNKMHHTIFLVRNDIYIIVKIPSSVEGIKYP